MFDLDSSSQGPACPVSAGITPGGALPGSVVVDRIAVFKQRIAVTEPSLGILIVVEIGRLPSDRIDAVGSGRRYDARAHEIGASTPRVGSMRQMSPGNGSLRQ